MSKAIYLAVPALLLLAGCGSKEPQYGSQGDSYTLKDVVIKTNRLEQRVDGKDSRIQKLEEQIQSQQKTIDDMNSTLNRQGQIAKNLVKVAYAQRQVAEKMQAGQNPDTVERNTLAKSVKIEKVDEKKKLNQEPSPEMTITRAKEEEQANSEDDFIIEPMEAATFRIKVTSEILDAPWGDVRAQWPAGELFTAHERAGGWIKVSGTFENGAWVKAEEKLWIDSDNITRLTR